MTFAVLARIRTVARGGDTLRAWRMFSESGLLDADDPEALSLKGRLLKDRALCSGGNDRATLLSQAQNAYMQAGKGRRATYPLINAATVAFLNGRPDHAARLARDVLALLESGDHEAETRYWLAATMAEAHLLLGDETASRAALEQAISRAPEAWEDHAATLRQFRQILTLTGRSADLFDHLRPPPSLYFSGIIGVPDDEEEARHKIGEALDHIRPGALYGALAAGADILLAELAVARGAELHVVLPTALDVFRDASVIRFGERWRQRFDRLIDGAASLEAPESIMNLSEAAITRGAEIAMGLALRRASAFATHAVALNVGRRSGVFMASDIVWQARGLPLHRVVLDQSIPPKAGALDMAVNRILLASSSPFLLPGAFRHLERQHPVNDMFFLELDDLPTAIHLAQAMVSARPECRLGLEYHTAALAGDEVPDEDRLAFVLARAAPAGSIWALWPQAVAMDILAPQCRFEFAGEIATPNGDFPVAEFCPTVPLAE
ncbi:DUF4071 domain-containing protein [Sphingobium lactosutens]|uniref:TRAFs-binding domain-containing protein n=1 Tax=Sphingobium lactosutens TaxID=522773 RepID=UPI0015BB263D|nr:TRAFs-binding domain-containing protein [Sphingobium lactosutens]NWK97565.1 DUF4071 domain-containing protein [Sphingobium lactosutens]